MVLAAVGRMQAAAHGDRLTVERLREALGETAYVIAQAKAALFAAISDEHKPDMTTLLDQLEHHVDAMIETAGGNAEAAPQPELAPQPAAGWPAAAAESDLVPTVSGVVSGLVSSEPAAADFPPAADAAPDHGPSVAMLKAMVEALSTPPPATLETPAPETAEAQLQIVEPGPPAAESQARLAEPTPAPSGVVMRELLASYELMEARPIPPPDEGTAVIFTPRTDPPASAEMAAAQPPATADAVEVSPVVAEAVHAAVETLQAAVAALPAAAEAAPAAVETPAPADFDFDPTDFLFGPEPEPDPAAFLLESSPPRETVSPLLPQAKFVSSPAIPSPPPMAKPPPVDEGKAEQSVPAATTVADPLAPLKAMTEAERIAIFS